MTTKPERLTDTVTLYEGDCLDVLPTLAGVDAVITDPPYSERTHAGAMSKTKTGTPIAAGIQFEPLADMVWLEHSLALARRWVVAFCPLEWLGMYAERSGKRWVRAGVWVKTNPMPQLTGDRPAQGAEGIAIMHPTTRKRWNGGGLPATWSFSTENGFLADRSHPTQKPLKLMRRLTWQFTDLDETILDPFAGSGTTGIAAMKEGRRCILIEKDPAYCEVIRRRVAEADGRGAGSLFTPIVNLFPDSGEAL